MDFLDPKKQRSHMIRLYVGYVLIGGAVLIATLILLYWAYGFGLDKNGQVVQNGLVFVASQPGNAEVYLDGKKFRDNTGTRIQLNAGNYSLDVTKTGYRGWHRDITVDGSSVSRYDYPLLVPQNLTTAPVKPYAALPALATQSPDRKWVLVQRIGSLAVFDSFDLSNPDKVSDSLAEVALPNGILTTATGEQSLKLVEWSTDNRRVVLQHNFAGGAEYILLDREEPESSVNLSKALGLKAGDLLSLRDKKYDKYYIHNVAAGTLTTATLGNPEQQSVLTGVVAFKSYADDIVLYATASGAPAGKLMTMLRDGDVTYKIREISPGGTALLDIAKYDGDWFVVVGSSTDDRSYVFKNPQAARKSGRISVLVPAQVLRVAGATYVAFSSNTRFIMAENGQAFAVYDAETDKGYSYTRNEPLDAPQAHASWMDGHRIMYISGGKTLMFDYDNINNQTLVGTSPVFLPFFDRDYRNLYALDVPTQATGQSLFTATSLLTPADR